VKVLVGCECSGIIRDAFLARGHDAISCDIKPSIAPGPHFIGDVLEYMNMQVGEGYFDLGIFHPPCTHLAVSGARWFKDKEDLQTEAIMFFFELVNANIPKIAIENPVGIMSTLYRKPDQYIQPWEYGHGETKKTCLWLKGLPKLIPTNIVGGREARVHKMPPSEHRAADRARTYTGWADAMAEQWGSLK
jgi:hypothetical protein